MQNCFRRHIVRNRGILVKFEFTINPFHLVMTRTDRLLQIRHRIKLRQLEALLAVVECGSMGKAAERLATSQPVVSKAIAELEHVLGIRLLDRGLRGAEPTAYGRALVKRSTAIFDEIGEAVRDIEILSDPAVGELRIGCTDSMLSGFLPVVIDSLCVRHPQMTLHVTQATSGEPLNRELRERKVDLILGKMALPTPDPDLDCRILFDEQQLVVAGLQSKWRRRRKIKLVELANERWVLPSVTTAGGSHVGEVFRSAGVDVPHAAIFSTSIQLYDALTRSGQYLAMYPASAFWFGQKCTSIAILPVDLPFNPWPIGIVTLKGRTISPAAELFIESARVIARRHVTKV